MKTVTDFLQVVLDQSQQALKKNEIPVGAVIYDPKKMTLISKAHNKELSSKDPTSHAEILCIRKACKKLNQKRLDGLIMITYLEPCNMCKEVIHKFLILQRLYCNHGFYILMIFETIFHAKCIS